MINASAGIRFTIRFEVNFHRVRPTSRAIRRMTFTHRRNRGGIVKSKRTYLPWPLNTPWRRGEIGIFKALSQEALTSLRMRKILIRRSSYMGICGNGPRRWNRSVGGQPRARVGHHQVRVMVGAGLPGVTGRPPRPHAGEAIFIPGGDGGSGGGISAAAATPPPFPFWLPRFWLDWELDSEGVGQVDCWFGV